ncbi:hypothetical protein LEMLEM_LOCUS24389 [Lemmus lemmus]
MLPLVTRSLWNVFQTQYKKSFEAKFAEIPGVH